MEPNIPAPVISLPIVPADDTFYYIVVQGSLHASDCNIFGLSPDEHQAICDKFRCSSMEVVNGSIIKGHCIAVINALAELGYRVISTTGEAEIVWTLQREL